LPAKRFLVVWAAVVLCFFSLSGSKLPSYILPMFPALALVAGDFLARAERRALLRHLLLVLLAAAVALGLSTLAPGFGKDPAKAAAMAQYAQWLGGAAGFWLLGSLGAAYLLWRDRLQQGLLLLAGTALLSGVGALLGHEEFAHSNSSYYLVKQLPATDNAPFYSLRNYDQTMPFYLGRTLTLVDYRDELDFGLTREPERGLPSLAAFSQRWQQDGKAYAVMPEKLYRDLQKEQLPMTLIARDASRIVVTKP
jgi:4-amino-4-deoxy-L-arabinose transferase-like glycosyltransferase